MFARTLILIAVAITGINAVCTNGTPGHMQIFVPGESCSSIATQAGITVAQLEAANPGLNCYALIVGQSICIPSN
ncbi:hypothetical protein EDD18DRAFT_1132091 [Armillaria luteobubalina]|uniref:LysM domain-containing protein n=1 Tax=Armillaria luteobubalina TaxID=153913 RepID=A0AA39QJJ5_9AGAR|nr:hypothetical protein EDD18DRAFT_1132091 [Armillaria luteobubalina]